MKAFGGRGMYPASPFFGFIGATISAFAEGLVVFFRSVRFAVDALGVSFFLGDLRGLEVGRGVDNDSGEGDDGREGVEAMEGEDEDAEDKGEDKSKGMNGVSSGGGVASRPPYSKDTLGEGNEKGH